MAWSRMFIKAKIIKKKTLFCAIITYSYYGLYHYDDMSIHDSIEEAKAHLLAVRCDGHLVVVD